MFNTILVVEDNTLDNVLLRNYLFGEKYTIVSAANGRDALEFIESRSIDLIILDLMMPVMDGVEFLKTFSKTVFSREIPVIVTTSLGNDETIESLIAEYEIYDFVLKPLDRTNRSLFLNKIKNALHYRNLIMENIKLKQQ